MCVAWSFIGRAARYNFSNVSVSSLDRIEQKINKKTASVKGGSGENALMISDDEYQNIAG